MGAIVGSFLVLPFGPLVAVLRMAPSHSMKRGPRFFACGWGGWLFQGHCLSPPGARVHRRMVPIQLLPFGPLAAEQTTRGPLLGLLDNHCGGLDMVQMATDTFGPVNEPLLPVD